MSSRPSIADMWSKSTGVFDFASSLADAYSGLGTWMGAILACAAIFITWALSRSEYKRTIRLSNEALNRDIDTIIGVVSQFELLYDEYRALLGLGDAHRVYRFYFSHLNDPRWSAMADFARYPISQWPSIECYMNFRNYWFSSIAAMETTDTFDTALTPPAGRISEHDGLKDALMNSLTAAKK